MRKCRSAFPLSILLSPFIVLIATISHSVDIWGILDIIPSDKGTGRVLKITPQTNDGRSTSTKDKMTKQVETLTEEVLDLNTQIDDLGRKSVPLILKCGEKLKQIKDSVKKSKLRWTDWQLQHKDRISLVTIWRYMRIWDISLLKEFRGKPVPNHFEGMTLNEVYEFCELVTSRDDLDRSSINPTKPKPNQGGESNDPNTPSPDGNGGSDNNQGTESPESNQGRRRKTKFEKFHSHLCHLQDLKKHEFPKEQVSVLVKCGEVFVKWYVDHGGSVPVKPIEVTPMKFKKAA